MDAEYKIHGHRFGLNYPYSRSEIKCEDVFIPASPTSDKRDRLTLVVDRQLIRHDRHQRSP